MFRTLYYLGFGSLGAVSLVLFGLFDVAGTILPSFGNSKSIDTESRRGAWYSRPIYVPPPPGRSPGGGGSYDGGGGWSGGK